MARGSAGMIRTRGGLGASDYSAGGGGGGGAPTDAQYWVGAANGTLTAEHNLGALATGLVKNTAGVPSIAVAGVDYAAASVAAVGANQVAYGTGTGVTGEALFVYNPTTNLLGVNTAAPTETLTIAGAGYFSGLRNGGGAAMAVIIDVFAGNGRISAINGSTRRTLTLDGDEIRAVCGTSVGVNVAFFRGGRAGVDNASCDFNPVGATAVSSGEAHLVDFNLANQGVTQFSVGAKTQVRSIRVSRQTIQFTAASTITTAATFAIENAPSAGANCTITNALSIWVQAGRSQFDTTTGGAQNILTLRNNNDTGTGTPHKALVETRTDNTFWNERIGTYGFGWDVSEGSVGTRTFEIEFSGSGNKITFDDNDPSIYPDSDGGIAIGTPSVRWGNVYGLVGDFEGDGTNVFALPADATGNATAAIGRIPVLIGGVTRYLRYYAD